VTKQINFSVHKISQMQNKIIVGVFFELIYLSVS